MSRQPAKRNTVQIDGVVIAAFLFSDDAVFFANAMNDADMFSVTNPGKSATAHDAHGGLIEPAAYKPD